MPINKKLIKEIMALPYRGLPVGGKREDTPPPSGPHRPRGGGGKASTFIEVWTFVSNTELDTLIPGSNWRRVFCFCLFDFFVVVVVVFVFFNSLKMTEKYIDHQEISPKKQRRKRSQSSGRK